MLRSDWKRRIAAIMLCIYSSQITTAALGTTVDNYSTPNDSTSV